MGATVTLNAGTVDVVKAVEAITGGRMYDLSLWGPKAPVILSLQPEHSPDQLGCDTRCHGRDSRGRRACPQLSRSECQTAAWNGARRLGQGSRWQTWQV